MCCLNVLTPPSTVTGLGLPAAELPAALPTGLRPVRLPRQRHLVQLEQHRHRLVRRAALQHVGLSDLLFCAAGEPQRLLLPHAGVATPLPRPSSQLLHADACTGVPVWLAGEMACLLTRFRRRCRTQLSPCSYERQCHPWNVPNDTFPLLFQPDERPLVADMTHFWASFAASDHPQPSGGRKAWP